MSPVTFGGPRSCGNAEPPFEHRTPKAWMGATHFKTLGPQSLIEARFSYRQTVGLSSANPPRLALPVGDLEQLGGVLDRAHDQRRAAQGYCGSVKPSWKSTTTMPGFSPVPTETSP